MCAPSLIHPFYFSPSTFFPSRCGESLKQNQRCRHSFTVFSPLFVSDTFFLPPIHAFPSARSYRIWLFRHFFIFYLPFFTPSFFAYPYLLLNDPPFFSLAANSRSSLNGGTQGATRYSLSLLCPFCSFYSASLFFVSLGFLLFPFLVV